MIRNLKQLDRSKLTAKDSARIYASRKRYLIKVEDDLFFTNNWKRYVSENLPEVLTELVEIYDLTTKPTKEEIEEQAMREILSLPKL